MNAINFLIAICALIIAAVLAVSFGDMKKEVSNSTDEKEKLRQELAVLEQMSFRDLSPKVNVEEVKQAEIDKLKMEMDELRKQQQIEQETAVYTPPPIIAPPVQTYIEEEEEIIPTIDPSEEKRLQRRAKIIAQALIMGQINQYYPEDGFVSLTVINYENVQPGVTLAIRRNDTGIVGQVEVTTVEANEAIANVLPYTFLGGEVEVQAGDELIINPL